MPNFIHGVKSIGMGDRKKRRRRSRRSILVRQLRWMAICLVIGLFGWFALPRNSKTPLRKRLDTQSGLDRFAKPTATKGLNSPIANGKRPMRVVFRYSVIPGGVKNIEELQNAIVDDPVVSTHYSKFDLSKARIIQLDRDRSVHVSYRIGNGVHWTKKKLKLTKGETLITDGVYSARTRCGNLISDTESAPIIMNEPTAQDMDETETPAQPGVRFVSTEETDPLPEEHKYYPPVILDPPGPPAIIPLSSPPKETHFTPVPEPSALLLLLIGFCTLVILQRIRLRQSN
jgi:hypothetical protein